MAQTKIDEILRSRQVAADAPEAEGDKFYSILLGEGLHEQFLELQFRDGTRTCFAYKDLAWFNHIPEDGLVLDFSGYAIYVKGRGLTKLFEGVKKTRVAWIKEADVELQDHKGNDCYVSEITIEPPEGFTGGEAAEE